MTQLDGQQMAESPYLDDIAHIVRQTLQLPDDRTLISETALLGSMPEFDSMSVVAVLTMIEDHFGFVVDDDDVSAETFATLGALASYVQSKIVE